MSKIHEQIPKIMGEIGHIAKTRKNPQQGYLFRGIDDVYSAVNQLLATNSVFCAPQAMDIKREERQTQKGGMLFYTIITMKYTFYADDGSCIEVITIGEAMDSGDKSCNKAMSAAQKYAFFQLFCIPTEESKDTEDDTHNPGPPIGPVDYDKLAMVHIGVIDGITSLAVLSDYVIKHKSEFMKSKHAKSISDLVQAKRASFHSAEPLTDTPPSTYPEATQSAGS